MEIYIKVHETPTQKAIREAHEETDRAKAEAALYKETVDIVEQAGTEMTEALRILGVNV